MGCGGSQVPRGALPLAAAEGESAASVSTQFGPKITKQMGRRGWTEESVNETITNPSRTVQTRDTRNIAGGGRMDDPATAYYAEDGSYVVRNDKTGDVVQVSNKNDPNWKGPGDK